jgi:serine acetyltransferase
MKSFRRFGRLLQDLIICFIRGWDIRLALLCDVHLSNLPKSTYFAHPIGVVISRHVVLGENCAIWQNVTIGTHFTKGRGYPVLGNNVYVGAGAIIVGKVIIGDNAVIGAGAIVLEDVPPNTTYVSKFEGKYIPVIENKTVPSEKAERIG